MNKQRLIDAEELKNQFKDYVAIGDKRFVEGMLHYRKIALGLIDNAPTIEAREQWISVKDRLPETEKDVYVVCEVRPSKQRYMCSAMYIPEKTIDRDNASMNWDFECCEYDEEKDIYWVLGGWYERIHNWEDYSAVGIADFVTHWMPLPEPPKEGKNEID